MFYIVCYYVVYRFRIVRMARPVQEYVPSLYDHVSRPLNSIECSLLKHHGLVIEPNANNAMESKVLHFGGRIAALYKIRVDSLGKFIGNKPEFHVYNHKAEKKNDPKIIEEKIEYYKNTPIKYDFFKNNCEDVICDILLKSEKCCYVKQNSTHTRLKIFYKITSFYLLMFVMGAKFQLLTLFFHLGFRKKNLSDVDALNFQDTKITDPNKRTSYRIKRKPMTIYKVGGMWMCGILALKIAKSIIDKKRKA